MHFALSFCITNFPKIIPNLKLIKPPVWLRILSWTAYDELMNVTISVSELAPIIHSASIVPLRKLNTYFNFFQSCSLLFHTLCIRKDNPVSISGRALFIMYNNFCITEWNTFNFTLSNCYPSSSTLKIWSADDDILHSLIVSPLYISKYSITSFNFSTISILKLSFFKILISIPKNLRLSPIVISISPKMLYHHFCSTF